MCAFENQPKLAEIRACIEGLIQTTDHSVLTVKGIRAQLLQRIDAEAGRDYDKSWLKVQVDEILAAQRTGASEANDEERVPAARAVEGQPRGPQALAVAFAGVGGAEPVGAAPKSTSEREPTAPVTAPKQTSEAPQIDPDSQMADFVLGTVLWAKLQGEPRQSWMRVCAPSVAERMVMTCKCYIFGVIPAGRLSFLARDGPAESSSTRALALPTPGNRSPRWCHTPVSHTNRRPLAGNHGLASRRGLCQVLWHA